MFKRLYTYLAIGAGFALLLIEIQRLRTQPPSGELFWIIVALALIGLGAAELFLRPRDR